MPQGSISRPVHFVFFFNFLFVCSYKKYFTYWVFVLNHCLLGIQYCYCYQYNASPLAFALRLIVVIAASIPTIWRNLVDLDFLGRETKPIVVCCCGRLWFYHLDFLKIFNVSIIGQVMLINFLYDKNSKAYYVILLYLIFWLNTYSFSGCCLSLYIYTAPVITICWM